MEVTVLRNLNVPVFRNVPYTADIERTVEDDTVIATVEATDEDSSVSDMSYVICHVLYHLSYVVIVCTTGQKYIYIYELVLIVAFNMELIFLTQTFTTQGPYNVIGYRIIGDDNAARFFAINEVSGEISVAQSVDRDEAEVYRVRNDAFC